MSQLALLIFTSVAAFVICALLWRCLPFLQEGGATSGKSAGAAASTSSHSVAQQLQTEPPHERAAGAPAAKPSAPPPPEPQAPAPQRQKAPAEQQQYCAVVKSETQKAAEAMVAAYDRSDRDAVIEHGSAWRPRGARMQHEKLTSTARPTTAEATVSCSAFWTMETRAWVHGMLACLLNSKLFFIRNS